MLPLVVGGDDVTVVMDARVAFDVTTAFLLEFASLSAADPTITDVVALTTGGAGLTACAGIAYVKPHSSFSESYQLAEQLCASAKRIKAVDRRFGALDFQVLQDTFGRDLDRVRIPLTVPSPAGGRLSPWAGPLVVTDDSVPVTGWVDAHRVQQLRQAMDQLRGDREHDEPPVINRSGRHQLRTALLHGGKEITRTANQVRQWAPDDKTPAFLDSHLCVPEPELSGTGAAVTEQVDAFSRIISAIDLLDMEAGTEAASAAVAE